MTASPTLISAADFAAKSGKSIKTIRRWCFEAMKPENAKPRVVCQKVGRDYEIDTDATERLHSQVFGSPLRKKLTRK